jgi:hypothetical protein
MSRGLTAIAAAAAFLAFVAVQIASPVRDLQFHADAHYMMLLVGDLIRGGAFSDWYLAPHFFVFPDFLFTSLILAAQGFGMTPVESGAVLYGAGWIGAGALLWRQWSGDDFPRALVWSGIVASLVWASAYLVGGPEAVLGGQVVPGRHVGSLMTAPYAYVAACRVFTAATWQRTERLWLAGLVLAIGVTVFSDLLFAVWGVAPILAVLASQVRRLPRRRFALLAGAVVGAMVVGYLISFALAGRVPENYYLAVVIQSWMDSTRAVALYFWRAAIFSASPVRSAVFYANLVLWVLAARAFLRELTGKESSPGNLLLIFMGAASAIAVVATVVPGAFKLASIRLFLPYILWGGALFVAAIPVLAARSRHYGDPILAAWLALAVGIGGWMYAHGKPLRADMLAACLTARQLDSGAASYWDALPVMDETAMRIHVVPLVPYWPDKFSAFEWMIKRDWLTQRARTGEPATVQFVIVSDTGPSAATVEKTLGAPTGRFPCADRTVLLFDPPKPMPRGTGN